MLRKLSPRTHASMKKRPKRLSAIGTLGDAVRQPLCRQGKSTKFSGKTARKMPTHHIKTDNVLRHPTPTPLSLCLQPPSTVRHSAGKVPT